MDYAMASNEALARLGKEGDLEALEELSQRSYPLLRANLLPATTPESAPAFARQIVARTVGSLARDEGCFISRLSRVACELIHELSSPPDEALVRQRDEAWRATWEAHRHYDENRANFPVQGLAPFIGQSVAWSPDGARIVDAAPDFGALWNKLLARGEDPSIYVYEDIPVL